MKFKTVKTYIKKPVSNYCTYGWKISLELLRRRISEKDFEWIPVQFGNASMLIDPIDGKEISDMIDEEITNIVKQYDGRILDWEIFGDILIDPKELLDNYDDYSEFELDEIKEAIKNKQYLKQYGVIGTEKVIVKDFREVK